MKRKFIGLTLALAMIAASLTGCRTQAPAQSAAPAPAPAASAEAAAPADSAAESAATVAEAVEAATAAGIAKEDLKIGAITIGDENEGYSAAHLAGIAAMKEALGLTDEQVTIKTNIGENEACYDAAADFAEAGCQIVFANSFGHETYMMQAAQDYPDVQFCHATGYQAKMSGIPNMHNYFTSVYESRYVSGVVAGMKLNEMIADGKILPEDAKVGYVGAYPYAEVISGFTSFFLGVRSECPDATMEVKYTNSWADLAAENEMAKNLIADGCVLISQHADTTGAPSACQELGVPCVGYNISMIPAAPDQALTSASINWAPYYTYAAQCMLDGEAITPDWCQGYAEGADKITELNEKAVAKGTAEKVAEVEAAIKDGSLKVFDTSTFTVGGKTLEELIAEGGDFAKYADYVADGYFNESDTVNHGSAPAFDLIIDGVEAVAN